jgi:hypothetical protein
LIKTQETKNQQITSTIFYLCHIHLTSFNINFRRTLDFIKAFKIMAINKIAEEIIAVAAIVG